MRTRRTIGLIFAGCVLVALLTLTGLGTWLGWFTGLSVALLAMLSLVGAYLAVVGPWQRHWGATDAEVARSMPGDEILPQGASTTTRAISIDATPQEVFPWLIQIGFGRAGWYSYDWIDNDGHPSLRRIDAALQHLAVGDRIEMMPGVGPTVRAIEPDRSILSGGDADSWCLFLAPTSAGRTRLISRWRQDWPKGIGTYLWIAIVDPGAFVMERKMLRTIRALVEGSTHASRSLRMSGPTRPSGGFEPTPVSSGD